MTKRKLKESAATPAPNADRGEHAITLGKKRYVLRPSFEAMQTIETATGQSLMALVRMANMGDLSLAHVGIIAAELIRAGAKDEMTRGVSAERIAELAYEEGLPHVAAGLTLCLIDAATGGRTVSGEARPVTVKAEAPVTGD